MASAVFDPAPTLRRVQSHIGGLGYFPTVVIGEPKSMAVNAVMTCAIFFRDVRVTRVSLSGPVLAMSTWARIYIPMLQEPQEQIEFALARAYFAILTSLSGDITLGDTVRNIDIGGAEGSALDERYGYADVSGTMCRVGDIALDVVIDQPGIFGYQEA